MRWGPSNSDMDIEAEIAARDGGEIFPSLPIGPGSVPARQPRLRLRHLDEQEQDAAADAVQHFAEVMASRIADADSWVTGEGYIGAIPDGLREVLLPFACAPSTSAASRPASAQHRRRRRRPPRVTQTQREARLDEALDDMSSIQRATPNDRRAIRKARRRVGRVRASMAQLELRRIFSKDEAKCVASILKSASADKAVEDHPDTCPIGRTELHRHFTGTSSVRSTFDYDASSGQEFRAALDSFEPAVMEAEAFDGEVSVNEVEDQFFGWQRLPARGTTVLDTTSTVASPRSWCPFCMPRFSFAGCTERYLPCGKWASFASSTRKVTPCSQQIGGRYAFSPLSTSCIAGCFPKGYRAGWKAMISCQWHKRGSEPSTDAMSIISWPQLCWTKRGDYTASCTMSGTTCRTRLIPCLKTSCGEYSATLALSPGLSTGARTFMMVRSLLWPMPKMVPRIQCGKRWASTRVVP